MRRQAVAWVDLDRPKRTGITRLDVYGEGDVGLEHGTESKTGGKLLCDLNTRGDVKFKGKVVQQPRKEGPTVPAVPRRDGDRKDGAAEGH